MVHTRADEIASYLGLFGTADVPLERNRDGYGSSAEVSFVVSRPEQIKPLSLGGLEVANVYSDRAPDSEDCCNAVGPYTVLGKVRPHSLIVKLT